MDTAADFGRFGTLFAIEDTCGSYCEVPDVEGEGSRSLDGVPA